MALTIFLKGLPPVSFRADLTPNPAFEAQSFILSLIRALLLCGQDKEDRFAGNSVQHKKNIADWANAHLDHAASAIMAACGIDSDMSMRPRRAIRLMMWLALLLLVAAPMMLTLATGAALALPLGFAFSGAIICMVLGALALFSRSMDNAPALQTFEPAVPDISLLPGLCLTLDVQARVLSMGGRDSGAFQPLLKEPVGHAFTDQLHVTDRILFIRGFDMLRQGQDVAQVSVRLARPLRESGFGAEERGTLMHAQLDLSALRDDNGNLTGVFMMMRDNSAEIALNAAVTRLQDEVNNANEAKSRFLAAVSHEMRTPLNAILGFSDILSGDLFGRVENESHREYIRLIRQSGGHLLCVVNSMLDMCRIEAGRYELLVEPFDMAETVQECEKMLSLQAREKGLTLTSRMPRDLGEIKADPRAIRQIIINLVGNAIKFTEPGGVISIDATRSGRDMILSVSDTGIGIAADKITSLGQPFTQVDSGHNRRHDGVGLGLSLVKGLVALHGGQFTIVSRKGEGTLVQIALPLDGTGAVRADAAGDETQVEFPPRLPSAAPAASMQAAAENFASANLYAAANAMAAASFTDGLAEMGLNGGQYTQSAPNMARSVAAAPIAGHNAALNAALQASLAASLEHRSEHWEPVFADSRYDSNKRMQVLAENTLHEKREGLDDNAKAKIA